MCTIVMASASSAWAQDFVVDGHWIDRCLGVQDNPMICVGQAAHDCAQKNGGGTNIVLGACHEAEAAFWDRALNEAYQHLLRLARDREGQDLGYAPDNLQIALQEMQLAWIGYRDASCGNAIALAAPFGSAAGPAYHSCVSEHTARQHFILRGLRRDYEN